MQVSSISMAPSSTWTAPLGHTSTQRVQVEVSRDLQLVHDGVAARGRSL